MNQSPGCLGKVSILEHWVGKLGLSSKLNFWNNEFESSVSWKCFDLEHLVGNLGLSSQSPACFGNAFM